MIYSLDEYVYLVKDKYTFKEQSFIDKGIKVYCLVAVNGDVVHGLLQSISRLSINEKDEAIKEYLKNRRSLVNFDYANAKPLVELVSYKIGK